MEELTIEEKAKRYGEALKRAKKLQETCDSMAVVGWCEYIFPELNESDGDKIRKVLLDYFQSYKEIGTVGAETFNGIPTDNILAWLEKQGEPEGKESDDELTWLKTFIEEEAYYLSMDIRDEDDRKKLIKLQNVLAWLEKQGERKPVSITDEWIEDYWKHHKVINPYSYDKGEEIQFDHRGFVKFCKNYCKKPVERSGEDERIRKALINFLKSPFVHENITDEKVAPWIAWLEKQGEQTQLDYEHADIPEKDLEDLFQALPEKIVDEKSHQVYELCVYHHDGQCVVDYVGEIDHDSLYTFGGDTLYDAIEKAWNWLYKNSTGG